MGFHLSDQIEMTAFRTSPSSSEETKLGSSFSKPWFLSRTAMDQAVDHELRERKAALELLLYDGLSQLKASP